MSTRIAFVAAALVTLALAAGAAQAKVRVPIKQASQPTHPAHSGNPISHAPNSQNRRHERCYWLPTVNNGAVSGLQMKCIEG